MELPNDDGIPNRRAKWIDSLRPQASETVRVQQQIDDGRVQRPAARPSCRRRFPGSSAAIGCSGISHSTRVDAAIGAFSTAVDLTQGSVEAPAALARGYAHAGDARGFDDTMRRIAARPYISPYTVATIRAAQGDVDAAVALLDAAFEQGVAALPYVAIVWIGCGAIRASASSFGGSVDDRIESWHSMAGRLRS